MFSKVNKHLQKHQISTPSELEEKLAFAFPNMLAVKYIELTHDWKSFLKDDIVLDIHGHKGHHQFKIQRASESSAELSDIRLL